MSLRNLQPKNLNAQMVDLLGQRIVYGKYPEGQQLPIESELCAEFGVSRPVVREATKILVSKGLLSIRPRVGTVAQARSNWNLLDQDVLRWVTESLPAETFLDMLFEARMAIEPYAAELAAQKATDDDIERIGQAYRDMEAAALPEQALEPDIRFHQSILEATHNEMIAYMGRTLHNALAISISLTTRNQEIHKLSLPRHKAVYTAIEKRRTKKAGEAVRALLLASREDF